MGVEKTRHSAFVCRSHCSAVPGSGLSAQIFLHSAFSRSTASRLFPWKPMRFMMLSGLPFAVSRLMTRQFGMAKTSHSIP